MRTLHFRGRLKEAFQGYVRNTYGQAIFSGKVELRIVRVHSARGIFSDEIEDVHLARVYSQLRVSCIFI